MAKVLFFFTSSYPYGTGETFIENEIKYLADAFDKIIIISSDTHSNHIRKIPPNCISIRNNFSLNKLEKVLAYSNLLNKDVRYEFLNKTRLNFRKINYLCQSYQKGKKIKGFLKRKIYNLRYNTFTDKIYLYSYWWLDESIGISLFKKQYSNVKAFSRAHGYDLYEYRLKTSYLPLKQFTGNYLNKILPISNNGKQYINTNYKINNVLVRKLGTSNRYAEKLLESNLKTLHIVSCSSIYPNKNILVIAKALQLIDNVSIKWTHLGSHINNFSEEYSNRVKELSMEVSGKNNIQINFLGNLPNSDILQYYSKSRIDLFLNVSLSEGIPVSIMEAMSFGIPCIASAVGGTPEIVNSQNGQLLSTCPTPEEVASKIIDYNNLSSQEKIEKRNAAYSMWNENYNAQKNYTSFVKTILKF